KCHADWLAVDHLHSPKDLVIARKAFEAVDLEYRVRAFSGRLLHPVIHPPEASRRKRGNATRHLHPVAEIQSRILESYRARFAADCNFVDGNSATGGVA